MAVRVLNAMPQQPQKKPRGRSWQLSQVLAKEIAKFNKAKKGKLSVTEVLRALEWTRYSITEACVYACGDVPAE